MNYRYISLFSGAGGLDIGLERAGFITSSMCEIHESYCKTILSNKGWTHSDGIEYFKDTIVLNSDIRDISKRDLTKEDSIDLIVGGPPCQAFSSSGKQLSVLDPRGSLLREYIRLIDEIKPKVFLFENVRGLITSRNASGEPGGVIYDLLRELEAIGYSCRSALLNSADYGSYQRRVRCFIIGSLKGKAPSFPAPTHSKNPELLTLPWNTLQEFLEIHADQNQENFTYPTKTLEAQLKGLPCGSGLKSGGKAEATRPGGHWGYRQGTFIADRNLPARTVTGSSSQDWVRWDNKLRRLTLEEIKKLQGFPEDWVIEGTKADRFQQIGNAVPTIFGTILASCIREHLDNFPTESSIKIDLPDSFKGYISYTKRDHARNHESRSVHKNFASEDINTAS